MTFWTNSKTLFLLSMGACLLILGCGKKTKTTTESIPVVVRPPQTEIDSYLDKQDVACEPGQVCPHYLSKVVIVYGNEYKFCTGFLTDDFTVATSSSCLPGLLRLNGQDCSKDVFFFFPKTASRPLERVGCSKVTLVSQLDGQDPILWRDDVAFLELQKPLPYRRQAQILREGLQNNKLYTTWMIDQQDQFSAIIKKSTCEAIHNNYVNPLAINESSPNMIFADCPISNSGTGSPVLDSRGKVRAILSRNMDQKLRTYLESTGLLTQGLKDMNHGTNFACAPTPLDNDFLDERECLKDLNYSRVDRFRAEMLSTNLLFGDLRKKFEDSLANVSRYVRFGVKLIPKGDLQETEIYPKCFKSLDNWLPSMNPNRSVHVDDLLIPMKSFKRAMDPYGRITGVVVDNPNLPNYVQFSLKNLRAVKRSSVLMWLGTENNTLRNFPNISEECSSSLL